MNLLVFGGTGRTGQVVTQSARTAGHTILAPTHADCNLRDTDLVSDLVLASGAETVINCAAVSSLETCLDDPLSAHLINAVAPAAMALACRHTGARFIHLSTDYVLDGRRPGKKSESSKCKPANIYGESKREGELQVLEALPGALIARVSWICGNPRKPSFVESTLAKALAGQPVAAIADKDSMPTDAADIARILLHLGSDPEGRSLSGIVQLCSTGEPQSWHSCALIALRHAVELGALPSLPTLAEQKLAQATFFRDARPAHTAMEYSPRLAALGLTMPDAVTCLRRVTERYLAAKCCQSAQ